MLLILLSASIAAASATDIYIAQSAAGAANGSSCANAYAASFFNASSNWGSGTGQIGAGTTVHLCGTMATNLTFQGNGASGSPVILDGTGATMNAYIDVCPTCQYWTIQNLTWSTSYATNSSTQAVLQINGGAFGTIQGNHIDVQNSAQVVWMWHSGGQCHDITVQNNFLRMTSPSGDGFDTDVIDFVDCYNIMIQGNYLELNITNDASQHDDITQTWGTSFGGIYNVTYRYNEFVLNTPTQASNNRSMTMLEGSTASGYLDIYANVFYCKNGGQQGNGIDIDSNSGLTVHLYNNTVVYESGCGTIGSLYNVSGNGAFYFENNINYSTVSGNALSGGQSFATRDFNLWYGTSLPTCVNKEICGSDPMFNNYSGGDFSLQAGSPAIGAGTNLGTSFNGYPLPGTTWPNPSLGTRAATGSWSLGAFGAGSTSPAPQPPTSLTAVVH